MGGDTWALLGEWGWGYRGTSGSRHMGNNYYLGNGGGATGALVGGDTWISLGEWLSLNRVTAALYSYP